MAITVKCTICKTELPKKGAVFIGRPIPAGSVLKEAVALMDPYETDLVPKSHLCEECEDWLTTKADERRQELAATGEDGP